MERRFEFEAEEVLALIAASRAAHERLMTEAQRYLAAGIDLTADDPRLHEEIDHPGTGAPPGLWLMNDSGVYLRSNTADGSGTRAHARGFRAEVQVGDEPMCEFIDAELVSPLQAGDTLVVMLREDKLRLSLVRPG